MVICSNRFIYVYFYLYLLQFYYWLQMNRLERTNRHTSPKEYYAFINSLRIYEPPVAKRHKPRSYTTQETPVLHKPLIDLHKPPHISQKERQEQSQAIESMKDGDKIGMIDSKIQDIKNQVCEQIDSANNRMIHSMIDQIYETSRNQEQINDSALNIDNRAGNHNQCISQISVLEKSIDNLKNHQSRCSQGIGESINLQICNKAQNVEQKQQLFMQTQQAQKISSLACQKIILARQPLIYNGVNAIAVQQEYGRAWIGNVKISLRVLNRLKKNHSNK